MLIGEREREREKERKPKMFFIRSLLKEYWNLGKAGKKKKILRNWICFNIIG